MAIRHQPGEPEMIVEFSGGLVNIVQRRAGKLELSARFQRNGAALDRVVQPDQRAAVLDPLPARLTGHSLQKGANAALPRGSATAIGNRTQVILVKKNFFVLGAKAEFRRGFAAALQPGRKFPARADGCAVRDVARHSMDSGDNRTGVGGDRPRRIHRRAGERTQSARRLA